MSRGKSGAEPAGLSQLNLNAAGIDVGASSHFVAVPADRAESPVQEFEAFTADLYHLAGWLGVPRQLYLPIWRQSVLPVHLLGLAPLLGCIGPVAGDVKLQDDGVVHHPVNRRGGGHGVGKDAFPLREDQV